MFSRSIEREKKWGAVSRVEGSSGIKLVEESPVPVTRSSRCLNHGMKMMGVSEVWESAGLWDEVETEGLRAPWGPGGIWSEWRLWSEGSWRSRRWHSSQWWRTVSVVTVILRCPCSRVEPVEDWHVRKWDWGEGCGLKAKKIEKHGRRSWK